MKLSQITTVSRENNLNIIRLIAAISVTFGHSFAMINPTGAHQDLGFGINSSSFGYCAVAIFFALSGFLILQSYDRSKTKTSYILARVLRIFPALFFANIVTAVLVGFFVLKQGFQFFTDPTHLKYIFNATSFSLGNYSDIFKMMPHNSPNGSLWTLPFEFRYYVLILILGVLGIAKKRFYLVLFLLSVFISFYLPLPYFLSNFISHVFKIPNYSATYLSLPLCFVTGMLIYSFQEFFKLNVFAAILCALGFYFTDQWIIKLLLLIYFVFVLGFYPKLYLSRLNFQKDFSYGIYVLSWPVQQTLIYCKVVTEPVTLFFISMSIVTPLAFISWTFFEAPALKLKSLILKKLSK